MACPSDPEAYRPKNFAESISGDQTWEKIGIRIKWTDPIVPGHIKLPINEPFMLRLCVEVRRGHDILPDALSAWCWTHIRAEDNKCGTWREIRLHYNSVCTQRDEHGNTIHVFQNTIVPTADDLYRLTFNVKHNKVMIWANYFQVDNMVDVKKKPSIGIQCDPNSKCKWKCVFANVPQTISFYAHYFSNLFITDNVHQQSTSGQVSREVKAGSKKKGTDDEIEVCVRV